MEFKVIDSSVLLHYTPDFTRRRFLAPDSVIKEIVDETVSSIVESAVKDQRLVVANPGRRSLERAASKAAESGDLDGLSKADLDVLALALEKKAVVVSDDYAIQNTARHLGLKTESALQDGIRETVRWVRKCEGCGKTYETGRKGSCDICGSRIVKRPSR